MTALIGKFFGSVFGGVWGYVAVAALAAAVSTGAAVTLTHKVELAKYEALQLKDAKAATAIAEATTAAVTAAKDTEIAIANQATAAAEREAAAQDKIQTRTLTITKEITHYVTTKGDSIACLPVGFLRVLNAAIAGSDTGTAGEDTAAAADSYDTCAPVKASDVAQQLIVGVIHPALENAEQLNALEAAITAELNRANADDK